MSGTTTTITRLVFPDQTNHHGTLFGGEALSMMASAAAISATRRARNPVVLARSDAIDFVAAVPSGSIVEVDAQVEEVGRTSLVVGATLHAEHLLSGLRRRSTSGRFVFVAVNEDGTPIPVGADEWRPTARAASSTRTTELVRPGQTDHEGRLAGGELMRLLDALAFIAATRHVRLPMVTARSEQVDFDAPVGVGELVALDARVTETRKTSLVIDVSVVAEDPRTGFRRPCTQARFVFAPARQPEIATSPGSRSRADA